MSNIFDLSKLSVLVEKHHPSRIFILDTNILMDKPDPKDWVVRANGKNLFVLSDTIFCELEFIKQKPAAIEKARAAIKSLASLFSKGSIKDGISIEAGWIIGVSHPRKNELDKELAQLEDIIKAFHRSDTQLLLLTKECHQLFTSVPVTFVTGEWNLFNIVQMQGLPCHHFIEFPIEGIQESSLLTRPIDWDHVIEEIQNVTKQKAINVEMTLTSQRLAPTWLGSISDCKPSAIMGHF